MERKNLNTAVGVAAAVLLLYMVNPWVTPPEGIVSQVVTIAFWVLAITLLVLLYLDARQDPGSDVVEVEGPAFARFLFNNSRAGLFWLPVRLFVGFAWLESGWGKLTNPENAWLGGGS